MCIFPWIDLPWYFYFMRGKHGRLNRFIQFICRVYLPLIWKYSVTHMHGLAVYLKEELPFSLENSQNSGICFWQAAFHSVSYLFSSINQHRLLRPQFLSQFHPTLIRCSQSAHLLMYLSLDTLMFIIRRTGFNFF